MIRVGPDNHRRVDNYVDGSRLSATIMARPVNVEDWIQIEAQNSPDGSWLTMMSRVAAFHHKHDFASKENHGHDMGYRVALTVEELGEFAAAITKGKPDEEAAEELADLLILILGHSLAMKIDLESEFHKKMDRIMTREARRGRLGIRVTEYTGNEP